ncbi:hypothetical protein C0J52_04859 [Blattella germanica]|nr:hypothetical protein C0J52_04859 [Blattella germanica]
MNHMANEIIYALFIILMFTGTIKGAISQVLGASPFTCTQVGRRTAYVINKCPEDWADVKTKRLCENSEITDPLFAAPVTSTRSNTTYSNWHCAACNKDILSDSTQIWLLDFACLCPNFFADSLIDSETAVNNLLYNSTTKSWHYKSINSTTDCECYPSYVEPRETINIVRNCDDTIIGKCAPIWIDKVVQKQCESYTDIICSEQSMYRNYHCMICNYQDIGLCFTANCSPKETTKRCRCDPDCARYGDCCDNSPYFVPEQQVLGASPFTCTQVGRRTAYVINKCPENWADVKTRRFCENSNSEISDPLFAAPVTSTRSNITYSNWYCGACNKDILSDSTQIWLLDFACLCPNFFEDSLIDSETAVNNLLYNSTTKSWHYKSVNSTTDCECYTSYVEPTETINIVRNCDDTVIRICAATWTDQHVQKQCESYTDIICSGEEKYRNYHCMICNFQDMRVCYQRGEQEFGELPTFSILLDWKRIKRSTKCSKSEVFDPIAREADKRCRCDPDCARYGDCCVNSPYFVPEQQVLGASPFTCTQVGRLTAYVINKCPEDWADIQTRSSCENRNFEITDPLLSAPVTSTSTNITYSNWHCAACNKDILSESTQIWQSDFSCFCKKFSKGALIDSETAVNNLLYNSMNRRWYYKSGSVTNNTDCECYLEFTPSTEINHKVRNCYNRIIRTCAPTWIDKHVQKQCESYTDIICTAEDFYRNYHCMKCNFQEFRRCFTTTSHLLPRNPTFSILLDWKRIKRNTKCSKSEVFDPIAQQQKLGASPFTCKTVGNHSVYIMDKCPESWVNNETRFLCEKPNSGTSDPLLTAPVTSTSTNTTYLNWHCAACHKDVLSERAHIWSAEFKCFCEDNRLPISSDDIEAWTSQLMFNEWTKLWSLKYINESKDGSKDHIDCDCFLDFTPPRGIDNAFRSCVYKIVNKCSRRPIWTDTDVQNECEGYTDIICSGPHFYRNYDCVLCNYKVLEKCTYKVYQGGGTIFIGNGEEVSFTMLLNWKRLKNNKKCSKSEIYDPLARICRQDSEYFVEEEQRLGGSRFNCTKLTAYSTNGIYLISSCPHNWNINHTRKKCEHPGYTYIDPLLEAPITSQRTNLTYRNSYCAFCNNDFQPKDDEIWPINFHCVWRPGLESVNSTILLQRLSFDSDAGEWFLNLTGLSELRMLWRIPLYGDYDMASPYYELEYGAEKEGTTCEPIPVQPPNVRYCDLDVINTCAENWTKSEVKESCQAYSSHLCAEHRVYRNYHCVRCNNLDALQVDDCMVALQVFINLTDCDQITFGAEEYELNEDNMTVFVPIQGKMYQPHEYHMLNGSFLAVCVQKLVGRTPDTTDLQYITIVGISMSIGFLVLHLAVFISTFSKRNLSSMNLASLCISLLVLYITFIVSGFLKPRSIPCVLIACLLHYALLTAFCWMLIISFDIWRALRQASSHFRLSPDSKISPEYGIHRCWIGNAQALIVFVAAPLAVVMVCNIGFFCWCAFIIYTTSADTSGIRTDFRLYTRLAFIMGLTWSIGLVAGHFNVKGYVLNDKISEEHNFIKLFHE